MNQVEYVYTTGMTGDRARECLAAARDGVLAFARDGESYAIPMAFVYDDDRLLFRFGDTDDSDKVAFADATTRATFTVYEYADPETSWSVVVQGPIRRTDLHPDDTTLNELYPPFRVFGESVTELSYDMYELRIEDLTGRETLRVGTAEEVEGRR